MVSDVGTRRAFPDPDLRRALDLHIPTDLSDETRAHEHRCGIEAVGHALAHTIAFVEFPAQVSSCAPYALHLCGQRAYRYIASRFDVFAGLDFMDWLAQGRLRELKRRARGALALYFEVDTWKHAGVFMGAERVKSKWGQFNIYDHGTWEVPGSYGDRVKFFAMPAWEHALQLFLEYARDRDVPDEVISAAARWRD